MTLIFIISPFTVASMGHPMEVVDVSYQEVNTSVSCLLLQHRAKEREKVVREILHLNQVAFDSPVARVMLENQLISNKLFLDPSLWEDHQVNVRLNLRVSPEFQAEVREQGLENIYLVIDAPGIHWGSLIGHLEPEVELEYQAETLFLSIDYPIYQHDFCSLQGSQSQVAWFGLGEDWTPSLETRDLLNLL